MMLWPLICMGGGPLFVLPMATLCLTIRLLLEELIPRIDEIDSTIELF